MTLHHPASCGLLVLLSYERFLYGWVVSFALADNYLDVESHNQLGRPDSYRLAA